MEPIAKSLKKQLKKPLQTLDGAMKSIAKSIHRTNGCAMLSIVLAMVCNGFIAFSMVFAMVSIAQPIGFAMVLLLFH